MSTSLRISLLCVAAVATGFSGCGDSGMPTWHSTMKTLNPFDSETETRSQSPDDDDLSTEVDTPMIGDHTTIAGRNYITLQGVGLVVGLDDTGSDPPPSRYRELILDEMRRRNIPNPNQLLASKKTALVIVRAYLPPLVKKGDRFDVEVRVPAESETISLNGGRLFETYLTEHALVPGQGVMEGHEFAKAAGPILVSTGEGDTSELAGMLRRGRVLGGGFSLVDRDLTIFLRNDFASFRNSTRIADRIGKRFYEYDAHGIREPLAEAKTHQRITLKLQDRYTENYPRYLQVIRHIAFRESDVARRVRMEKLERNLNNPPSSEKAALALEAMGNDAIPVLKEGLQNPSIEVRFHAATSLAYLGDAAGIDSLAEAAREESAFRVFALAALASLEDAASHVALRDLMSVASAETRYGAFRALSVLDENDPFIRGQELNKHFKLHVLRTTGDPMVHMTTVKKPEIVLFGADQEIQPPLALRAGSHILITAAPGSRTVTVSRYGAGLADRKETVSTRIADVIRAIADMDASYPDVAQFLVQANNQGNLPGRFEINAVPKAGRVFVRADSNRRSSSRVGGTGLVPNLFEGASEKPESRRDVDEDSTEDVGEASVSDISKEENDPADDLITDDRPWYDISRLFQRKQFSANRLEKGELD